MKKDKYICDLCKREPERKELVAIDWVHPWYKFMVTVNLEFSNFHLCKTCFSAIRNAEGIDQS